LAGLADGFIGAECTMQVVKSKSVYFRTILCTPLLPPLSKTHT
jgi:hypothetical protein